MATGVRMADTTAAAAVGDQLPNVPIVKKWAAVELLSFIESQNILQNVESREKFEATQIDGNSFLIEGDSTRFWRDCCELQIAPSIRLFTLVKKTKRIGDEQSSGNTSFVPEMSRVLSNWLILRQRKHHPSDRVSWRRPYDRRSGRR